jgi:SAM-dependent methyltransferase
MSSNWICYTGAMDPTDTLLRDPEGEDLSQFEAQQAHLASAQAFSLYAPSYDAEQASNKVAQWSRARNLRILEQAFPPGSRLLELGCGTGVEAIHLARRGRSVVATDAAPAMIETLEGKLQSGRIPSEAAGRISTRVMPAADAYQLVREFGEASFDGAYSSFGPLNCEPDLGPVLEALAALVAPGGRVVLSLIGRYCAWETAWYLAHGKPNLAFRRWKGRGHATVKAEWQEVLVPIYYWSLREIDALVAPYFRVASRRALPWLLPPQYLDGLTRRGPRLFSAVARIDRRLAGFWPFYWIGDHFVVELVRR